MESGNPFNILKNAISKFKSVLSRQKSSPKVEEWRQMAEEAARDLIPDSELSSRERAQIIGFNFRSKVAWMAKHLKYVAQASPLFFGYKFLTRLSREAKANALDHSTEDMRESVRRGRYRPNIIEEATTAHRNVQQLRAGTRKRCSYLLSL
jgi:hypothetical protein